MSVIELPTNIVFVHKKVPPRYLKTTKKFCPIFYWKYIKYSQFFSTVAAVLKSSHTLLSTRFWKTQTEGAETSCHMFIHHLPCHLQEHLTFSLWTNFTLIFYSFFFVRSCWNVHGLERNPCGLPFLTSGIPLSRLLGNFFPFSCSTNTPKLNGLKILVLNQNQCPQTLNWSLRSCFWRWKYNVFMRKTWTFLPAASALCQLKIQHFKCTLNGCSYWIFRKTEFLFVLQLSWKNIQ